ncbi:MAG: RAMP superfamily CRISPR-associated protein, partial [Pseudomonadales bacterium]|nr:RAMP superfamily CRISPR-associated protein [Pseudomonadales bacterium]
IERHVYTGALQLPFIPGTSFKGALRTAWLDDLNNERPPQREDDTRKSTTRLEKRLLQGDFQTSPLRLLKVADLMPAREPEREVLFAVNRKKDRVIKNDKEAQPKGIAARKDCILPGQYRLLKAAAALPALLRQIGATDNKGQALTPQSQQLTHQGSVDLKRLAQRANAYHLPRFRRELSVLDGRGFVDPAWKRGIESLIKELDQKFKNGDAFLIRLGRYGGAESKTLSGEGVASIKIMGAKGSPATFESSTKTVWLAARQENDQKQLIPFGWAIVEIDPHDDCTALQQWCDQQNQGRPNMAQQRAKLQAQRQQAEAQKAHLRAEAAARAEAAEAARIAALERAHALEQMTPRAQQIEKLRQACEDWEKQLHPHGNYKKQPAGAHIAGLYQDADRLVKSALQDLAWNAADKATLADMLETWLPKVIERWDAKEQRKKLKFAQLRGNA